MLSHKTSSQIQAFECPWFPHVVYRLLFFIIIVNMKRKQSDSPRLVDFAFGRVEYFSGIFLMTFQLQMYFKRLYS